MLQLTDFRYALKPWQMKTILDSSSYSTLIVVIMPDSACAWIWQWVNQIPSATGISPMTMDSLELTSR